MVDRPDWIDTSRYPFESNWLDVSGGRMHYVDEGSGPPVLLLHGNPTWSFMYREAIKLLSDRHRCIVPDQIGFGLSDKPSDWGYRPWEHADNVSLLLEDLGVEEFHLVVHDWGGPIGMALAREDPDRLRRLAVLNSWMWPMDSVRRARLFSRTLGSRLGKYLVRNLALFEKWLMPWGVFHRETFDGAVHDHYLKPFSEPETRNGVWRFPVDILEASDWLNELWGNRGLLGDVTGLVLWGLQDPAFTEGDLDRWKQLFRQVDVRTFEDASHYVMEDKGREVSNQLRRFFAP